VWLETISQAYANFPDTAKMLASLAVENPQGDYSLQDGIIRFRGKILVRPDTNMQLAIISTLHNTAVGGHSGGFVTYQKVK